MGTQHKAGSIIRLIAIALIAHSKIEPVENKTTQIDNWQGAIAELFLNPRGNPLEPNEALTLLELAQGRKVGPYDVDSLLNLNAVDKRRCNQEFFDEFDRISKNTISTLDLYMRQCLKKQVKACEFEHNFMRNLAKLSIESLQDLVRLADSIQDGVNSDGSDGSDMKAVAKALEKLVRGDANHLSSVKLHKQLLEFMNLARGQCKIFENNLKFHLTGLMRDPDALQDPKVLRWYKASIACEALKDGPQLSNEVHDARLDLEERQKVGLLGGLRKVLGY